MRTVIVRLAQVAAAFLWMLLVFLLSFWLTFPSEALANRIRWGVQESGRYLLELGAVSPSGFGVRADDFALYSVVKGRRKDDAPKTVLMFEAEQVRLRTGPFSLLNLFVFGGNGRVNGSVTRAGGDLDFSTLVERAEDDKYIVRDLTMTGEGLPLSAFPAPDAKLVGTGGWDLDIGLDSSEGLSKADGHIAISSSGATIEKIEAAALQGFDIGAIQISQIDVAFDVTDGKAKISRGSITSDLAQIDIEGDVSLTDDLVGSRLRLKFVIEMAEGPLSQMVGAFAKDAKWDDGKLHYALSGTISKPRPRPERERKVRTTAPRKLGPDLGGPLAGPDIDVAAPRDLGQDGAPVPDDDPEREARRQQREDAIRQRREALRDRPVRPGGVVEPPLGDEPPPLDEELPPGIPEDDGGPPIDEEPPPFEEEPLPE
jgi:type II secretion system protein N